MVLAGGMCTDFGRRIQRIRNPSSAEPISRRASSSQLAIMGLDHAIESHWGQCLHLFRGSVRKAFNTSLPARLRVVSFPLWVGQPAGVGYNRQLPAATSGH